MSDAVINLVVYTILIALWVAVIVLGTRWDRDDDPAPAHVPRHAGRLAVVGHRAHAGRHRE